MTDQSSPAGPSTIWSALDLLAAGTPTVIDRPGGSAHPRFQQYVYPVDYGYFEGTRGGDGVGIDLFRGSATGRGVTGLVATFDPCKGDAELKVLLECTADEMRGVERFYEAPPQAALVIPRGSAEGFHDPKT